MTQRPDIVVIISDQQHAWACGRRDAGFVTPHQDALAAEGIDCTRVYCTTPLCSPSRSTLLTGRYPHQTGVVCNGCALEETTIAQHLQAAGYTTAWFGKWHLKDDPRAIAGWDEQQGVCDEYRKPNRPLGDDETLAHALDFLDRHGDDEQPFALFVSFDEPHGTYAFADKSGYPADFCPIPTAADAVQVDLPATWDERDPLPLSAIGGDGQTKPMPQRFDPHGPDGFRVYRALYRDRVAAFDQRLGRLLARLRAVGRFDHSFLTVTSDHGDMDGHHHLLFKDQYTYEQVQRVPLVLRLPGGAQSATSDDLISLVDLPATLLDMAGGSLPGAAGDSLLPCWRGDRPAHPREDAVVAYAAGDGSWTRTLIHGRWKYVRHSDGREQVIDVHAHPDETRSFDDREVVAMLRQRLLAWADRHGDREVLADLHFAVRH